MRNWHVLLTAVLVACTTTLSCVSQPAEPAQIDTNAVGGLIAFESERNGNREVYIMNPDGSKQTRLTNNSAYDGFPTWSVDGRKIAFDYLSNKPVLMSR